MYDFVIRDPAKGYVGSQMFLPRNAINKPAIKRGLEFQVTIKGETDWMQLWEETDDHLIIPRSFLTDEVIERFSFPIISTIPRSFPRVRFRSKITLDKKWPDIKLQRPAFKLWKENGRQGILNLACGRGKTIVALYAIAYAGTPTLIIVHTTTIDHQWRTRINEFLEFDGEIGKIQGNPSTWNWRQPITVASLDTMAMYPDAVTPEMRRFFGSIWWDELQHLAAPTFCITADMFPGKRNGLSATLRREDGLHPIYFHHIGQPYYSNLYQDIVPLIFFRYTPFTVNSADSEVAEQVLDINGQLSLGKMRTYMGTREDRNDFLCRDIDRALAGGRKILALSHSIKQSQLLHERYPEVSGLCTGREKVEKRWDTLSNKQLTFGTHQLVLEAIDEDSLDCLLWLTPFGSQSPDGGFNALQQGIGRLQRYKKGKPQPVVIIYDDRHVRWFTRMCRKLRYQLRNWPADMGGPYNYKRLREHDSF